MFVPSSLEAKFSRYQTYRIIGKIVTKHLILAFGIGFQDLQNLKPPNPGPAGPVDKPQFTQNSHSQELNTVEEVNVPPRRHRKNTGLSYNPQKSSTKLNQIAVAVTVVSDQEPHEKNASTEIPTEQEDAGCTPHHDDNSHLEHVEFRDLISVVEVYPTPTKHDGSFQGPPETMNVQFVGANETVPTNVDEVARDNCKEDTDGASPFFQVNGRQHDNDTDDFEPENAEIYDNDPDFDDSEANAGKDVKVDIDKEGESDEIKLVDRDFDRSETKSRKRGRKQSKKLTTRVTRRRNVRKQMGEVVSKGEGLKSKRGRKRKVSEEDESRASKSKRQRSEPEPIDYEALLTTDANGRVFYENHEVKHLENTNFYACGTCEKTYRVKESAVQNRVKVILHIQGHHLGTIIVCIFLLCTKKLVNSPVQSSNMPTRDSIKIFFCLQVSNSNAISVIKFTQTRAV
jgi:hypothetical protein